MLASSGASAWQRVSKARAASRVAARCKLARTLDAGPGASRPERDGALESVGGGCREPEPLERHATNRERVSIPAIEPIRPPGMPQRPEHGTGAQVGPRRHILVPTRCWSRQLSREHRPPSPRSRDRPRRGEAHTRSRECFGRESLRTARRSNAMASSVAPWSWRRRASAPTVRGPRGYSATRSIICAVDAGRRATVGRASPRHGSSHAVGSPSKRRSATPKGKPNSDVISTRSAARRAGAIGNRIAAPSRARTRQRRPSTRISRTSRRDVSR